MHGWQQEPRVITKWTKDGYMMQSKSMKAFQFGIKMNTWVNTKWYMVDLNSAWKLLKMMESTAKRSRAVFIAIPIWWKSNSRNRIPIVTHTSKERSYIYRPRESIGLTLKSKKEADPSRQNCTLERSPGEKKTNRNPLLQVNKNSSPLFMDACKFETM